MIVMLLRGSSAPGGSRRERARGRDSRRTARRDGPRRLGRPPASACRHRRSRPPRFVTSLRILRRFAGSSATVATSIEEVPRRRANAPGPAEEGLAPMQSERIAEASALSGNVRGLGVCDALRLVLFPGQLSHLIEAVEALCRSLEQEVPSDKTTYELRLVGLLQDQLPPGHTLQPFAFIGPAHLIRDLVSSSMRAAAAALVDALGDWRGPRWRCQVRPLGLAGRRDLARWRRPRVGCDRPAGSGVGGGSARRRRRSWRGPGRASRTLRARRSAA